MPVWLNWLLAILVILFFLAVFLVTFILYKRTPPPKGCENLVANDEKCRNCKETGCQFNLYGKPETAEKRDDKTDKKPGDETSTKEDK
ncbi:MAG: hypothetical protein LKM30_07435 [Bacilli bacterium]|jgi:hypothetical protein|nr:hypothetical protein [Bacilli bacterium]